MDKRKIIISVTIALVAILIGHIAKSQIAKNVEPAVKTLSKYQKIRDFTITSDGDEGYITLQSPLEEVCVIAMIKKSDNMWSEPEVTRFSGKYKDLEPFLSPDNLKLYFVSNRPLNSPDGEPKDYDIWYVERENPGAGWGMPVNIGEPVNTEHNEFYPAITNSNNLYITSDRPDSKGQDDIFFCGWNGNQYSEPVSMSESINSESYEFNAYVDPDESYLIFSGYNREDGYGSGDMYISFRDSNQNWSEASNLGDGINSKYMDYCPFVDLINETLYFTSRRSSIEPRNDIHSLEDLDKVINIYENGNSRLYKVKFDLNLYRD